MKLIPATIAGATLSIARRPVLPPVVAAPQEKHPALGGSQGTIRRLRDRLGVGTNLLRAQGEWMSTPGIKVVIEIQDPTWVYNADARDEGRQQLRAWQRRAPKRQELRIGSSWSGVRISPVRIVEVMDEEA